MQQARASSRWTCPFDAGVARGPDRFDHA